MNKRCKLLIEKQNSKSQMDILELKNISDWIALLAHSIQQRYINRNHPN